MRGPAQDFQKAQGYRFSVDSLLLAWFTRVRDRGRVLDLGSGSGILSAVLAFRFPAVEVTGIEIQEELARMARRTAALNGLEERVRILRGDASEIRNLVPPESFDVAVFNPPYRKLRSGRMNENAERAVARHELRGSLGTFLKAARYALRGGARPFSSSPPSGRRAFLEDAAGDAGAKNGRRPFQEGFRRGRSFSSGRSGAAGGAHGPSPLFLYGEGEAIRPKRWRFSGNQRASRPPGQGDWSWPS